MREIEPGSSAFKSIPLIPEADPATVAQNRDLLERMDQARHHGKRKPGGAGSEPGERKRA